LLRIQTFISGTGSARADRPGIPFCILSVD
jgi:hypothetical protein